MSDTCRDDHQELGIKVDRKKPVCVRAQLCPTLGNPRDAACQASLSLGARVSGQEYWRELPFLPPGDLPSSGTEPLSPVSLMLTGGFFTTKSPGKPKRRLLLS